MLQAVAAAPYVEVNKKNLVPYGNENDICRMPCDNNGVVVARAKDFLNSMRFIVDPSDIGADLCQHPDARSVADLCAKCARGVASDTPASLTLALGKEPTFDIKGAHAYGTLAENRGLGSWLMVTLTIAVLMIAWVLCRK